MIKINKKAKLQTSKMRRSEEALLSNSFCEADDILSPTFFRLRFSRTVLFEDTSP
jgi:hypothetical protein